MPRAHAEGLPRAGLSVERGRGELWFALALTLSLAAAAAVDLFNLGLQRGGDPDEGVYLGVARLLNHGFPYSSFFFDQLSFFPQVLAAALRLGGDSLLAGRQAVVLFALFGLVGLALLARGSGGRAVALLAVLFAAANHYYLMQSRYAMADVPSIALMLWALLAVGWYVQRGHRLWLVAGASLFTASLLTKPLTIGFAATAVWWLVARHLAASPGRLRFNRRGFILDLLIFGGASVVTALPFLDLLNLPHEFVRTVGFHFQEARLYAPLAVDRAAGLVSFLVENRMWFGLGLLGAVLAVARAPGRALPLLAGELASALVLLQLPPFRHHYAVLAPLLALFAAYGAWQGLAAFGAAGNWIARYAASARVGPMSRPPLGLTTAAGRSFLAALLIAGAWLLGAALWLHDVPQLARYDLAVIYKTKLGSQTVIDYVRQRTTPGDFLLSDDPMVVYASGGLIPPPAINLSYAQTFDVVPDGLSLLASAAQQYPLRAVVVAGPYRSNRALMEWIQANYPVVRRVRDAGGQELARVYSRE